MLISPVCFLLTLLHAPMSEDAETWVASMGPKTLDQIEFCPWLEEVNGGRIGDFLSLLIRSLAERSLVPINSLFLGGGLLGKTTHWLHSASRARVQLSLSVPTNTSCGSVKPLFKLCNNYPVGLCHFSYYQHQKQSYSPWIM